MQFYLIFNVNANNSLVVFVTGVGSGSFGRARVWKFGLKLALRFSF